MSTSTDTLIAPEDYLEAERRAETKSEYICGEIFPMPGASRWHNFIVVNLIMALGAQLKSRPLELYPSDMRVKVSSGYVYPDVVVVNGTAKLEDDHHDTLMNPTFLVEVLSESTERHDRRRKAELYRRLPSLQEYLFVAQDEPRVEQYRRKTEREWIFTETTRRDDIVTLGSIDCSLPLQDVYHNVPDQTADR